MKLQYINDDPDSYANIFDSAKTTVTNQDKTRLIETLKTLNGDNAQDAVFADEVIRYLAVHDFLQNDDSYTGMMVHNYYLYEEDGKLAIIPWDYNLAFGGMGGGSDASATVNSPIDSPVSNGTGTDRPLISWILENEDTLAQYHEVYSQFIADTVESGWLESEIARVAEMIRPYVEADPNGFYSTETFDTAVEALQTYCALRGESIRGQLEGTIPSTSARQSADRTALVDAGSLRISDMGSMNTGGGGRSPGGGNSFGMPGSSTFSMPDGSSFSMSGGFSGMLPDSSSFSMPDGSSFSMPGGFSGMPDTSSFSMPSGFGNREDNGDGSQQSGTVPDGDSSSGGRRSRSGSGNGNTGPSEERASAGTGEGAFSSSSWQSMGMFPSGSGMSGRGNQTDWITFGICAALLLAAVFFAGRIRGHNA